MSAAMFRLESFAAPPAPEPVFTRADLDAARAEGHAAGLAQAQDEQAAAATRALTALAASLSDDDARRGALRDEAVEALSPILRQILRAMAPPAISARIEDALRHELRRLAADTRPQVARIACGPRLRAMLNRCLADAGLTGIQLQDRPDDRLVIDLQGGRIEYDPERVMADLLTILDDIQKDDTTWTR